MASHDASHPSEQAPPAREAIPWRTIRPRRRWPRIDFREVWRDRELALMLALRDLQLRYRQTLFGIAWALLQPLAAMAAFSLFFGKLAGLPSEGLPYPLFVLAAVGPWFFLSGSVDAAAESLVEQPELVTKVWFPRILAPTAAVLAVVVDLVISLTLLVPLMIGYQIAPPLQVLTLPLWLGGLIILALAVGFWFSAANVLYRDVRYALPFLLQVWLFVSPVAFPSSLVHGGWQYVYALNPAVGLLDGLRWALLDAPAPGLELLVSLGSLTLILIGGALYFTSVERSFSDRI